MMSVIMYMPDTPEEFIKDHQFVDTKEYYTNGSELISVYRVEQMIEHYFRRKSKDDAAPVVHARWVDPCINKYGHPCHHCSACRFKASQKDRNYCPNCGARMDEREEAENADA